MTDIRILHVDDERDVRLLVEASLGLDPGLVTQSCASGAEAITLAAQWRPDLILLDATMPDMDGPATLAQLKTDPSTADIPVLFLTASCGDSDIDQFRAMGSVGVIAKPFDPRALAPSVRSHAQPPTPAPAATQPAVSRPTAPAGAAMPDTGPVNVAAGREGNATAGFDGPTSPGTSSGIVPVDRFGGPDWSASPFGLTGDGHVDLLLDADPRQATSLIPTTAGPPSTLFSGSRASGYDASSDLVHAPSWQGDPLTTGPGHDLWTVGTPSPVMHGSKPWW